MGFEKCGPNEAIVITGCGHDSPCIISGGRVWVWPYIQDSFYQVDSKESLLRIRASIGGAAHLTVYGDSASQCDTWLLIEAH